MRPRPARPDERSAALQMLLSHHDAAERDARRLGLLDALADGTIDGAGLLVLPGLDRLLGAILAAPVPGAGGILWPPAVATLHAPGEAASLLIEAAWAWLRSRGARVVQSLLGPAFGGRTQFLLDNGFRRVTTLITFTHGLVLTAGQMGGPDDLQVEPYDVARPDELHAVLLRSYEGSLDCPEVNGARTIEEVIAGHKEQGVFDPANWWLARHNGRAVAVLLMMDQPSGEEREIAYVGVVPEARRRGHARELLLRALAETRAAGVARLVISVDERNSPAWKLYERLGFEEAGRQAVLLRLR